MKRKSNTFLKRLALTLGVTSELDAQERLDNFIRDQQHISLLERIKAIRNNSYYEPDYNKSKSFTDIKITVQGQPISGETRLAHERPVDFGNDIRAWQKSIRIDSKKEMKARRLKEEQEENWNKLIELHYTPYVMKDMMEIY